MISIHQGKLLKGFFTKKVSVHPEINNYNKCCKHTCFITKIKKTSISPSKKQTTCKYN